MFCSQGDFKETRFFANRVSEMALETRFFANRVSEMALLETRFFANRVSEISLLFIVG